jgi:hypothetical protein
VLLKEMVSVVCLAAHIRLLTCTSKSKILLPYVLHAHGFEGLLT